MKARHGTHSLVECRLLTGRNHQIRVHLAAVGHPVLGDEYYAANGCIRRPSEIEDTEPERRHALHACQLTFEHPILQKPLTFKAPPPNDFWELADVN